MKYEIFSNFKIIEYFFLLTSLKTKKRYFCIWDDDLWKIKCRMKDRPCRDSNPKRHHGWSERYAAINFIQKPPGHDSKGEPSPGTIIVYKTLPSGQNRQSKAPPPEYKVRKFRKCIYKL